MLQMIEDGLGVVASTPAVARSFARRTAGAAQLVATSYGDAARARVAARQLAAKGARALISFGPAVGLAPLLRPGDLVVAECVVLPSGATIATDPVWRSELVRGLRAAAPNLTVARLAGRDQPAASVHEKRCLFRATFAAALDGESHAIAEEALAHGLPFLAVRAVAEPAEARLGPRWDLAGAWRLARSRRAALVTLRQAAAQGSGPLASGGERGCLLQPGRADLAG
jgi:adenosylhomocysteine nucleosidase